MSYLIWSNPEYPKPFIHAPEAGVESCLKSQALPLLNSRLLTNVRTCLGYQFSSIFFVEGGKHRPTVERMS